MDNSMSLNGKTIIVSGASSGIGRAIAIQVSKQGAKVILLARNEEKLQETLNCMVGKGHKSYSFDLSNLDEIEPFIKQLIKDHGSVDGYVHSAGVGSTRPLHMLKPSKLQEVMNVNFNSFVEIVRCLAKRSNLNEKASIVGISSVAGQEGNQSKTAYCASKAAMDAAVRCIAKELSSRQIRANTIAPGLADTDMFQQFINNSGADSEDARNVLSRQYLGVVPPEEIAFMVAFLLSNASSHITGTTIAIDSGRLSS